MALCPTCGQTLPQIDKPIVDLAINAVLVDGEWIKLSGREAEVLSVLAQTMPRLCSHTMIYDAIYTVNGDAGMKTIVIFVCRLRDKLSHTNLSIMNVWGRGYKLVRNATGTEDRQAFHPPSQPLAPPKDDQGAPENFRREL